MDETIKLIQDKRNRGAWLNPEEAKQIKDYEKEQMLAVNLIECNIYVEGVGHPVVRSVFLHRESGGFSSAPILAVRGEQIDVVKEIEYELNRIGYKKHLTKT